MISRDIARRARRFEIRTRRLLDSGFAGEYRSVFRGRGVEFDEVRAYQEGDDVRLIDWNVTARTGEPHIKKHVEEREQTILVAVDVSASLGVGFGRETKRELAAEVGSVLCLAAGANNDRTALLLFSDRVERYTPPGRGTRHAMRIAQVLLGFEPKRRGTDLNAALQFAFRVVQRSAVVFLISDYWSGGFDRSLSLLARRHDVVAVTVTDPREFDFPAAGIVTYRDAETGECVDVDLGDRRVREVLGRRVAAIREARERVFTRVGVDHLRLAVGEPYERALHRLFAQRARRAELR